MDTNAQNEHAFAAKILVTYTERYSELDPSHAFHFASRLSHWTGSEWSRAMLDLQKPSLLTGTSDTGVTDQLKAILASGNEGMEAMNAAASRQPYFEKYPSLRGTTFALFRLRHWLMHYDFDARAIFTSQVVSIKELEALQDAVFSDTQALAVLSTHAINYYYLLNRLILANDDIPMRQIEDALKLYDTSKLEDMLLYIYLLTHCIIGESLFYVNSITGAARDYYVGYMKILQTLLTDHYNDINLDNKCEYLVCAELLNYDTGDLRQRIFDEATQSVSDDGFYIVDRHNNNPQLNRTDLNRSEHRNVLFIMAFGPKN